MKNEKSILLQKYQDLLDTLITNNIFGFNLEDFRNLIPKQSGVYFVIEEKNIIYVGKSKNLQNRIYKNHLMGNRKTSTLRNKLFKIFLSEDVIGNYLQKKCAVQFIIIEDETDRKFFEHYAISILKPKFND